MKRFLILFIFIISGIHLVAQCELEAKIEYELYRRDAPNELVSTQDIEEKRFSAPAAIHFYGEGSGEIDYRTWYIYNKKDLANPIARYTDKDINYTFEEAGHYLIMFEVADSSSECVVADTLSFQITESDLDVPNYFSPGNSLGGNDEFRVAYRSLVKFKCTIFNRWGQKLFEFTDPAKGWDGRYKGNYVNTGVYFYVIEALGSDGVKYKRGGDINVLRSR
ncbi:gliding motility-associated C-terminal domain-containing protein [Dysgonomonas sp. Marseille-P4677]|uniref:T9SS type B sorting domain-containing protein n=1 Tax=Dysgonomonas sp. Marseille-P4677 TaxID=2364790 RepID=UPI001912A949|nr:gliding motility-associated C-terminal domain-containing protein [Dysgonomonas sp. Marseille-P4677]MBK5720406.1 gliding motility-associated C-terminal domain-containing protein [Dysgonomonas sp. Marseille-P4677]